MRFSHLASLSKLYVAMEDFLTQDREFICVRSECMSRRRICFLVVRKVGPTSFQNSRIDYWTDTDEKIRC